MSLFVGGERISFRGCLFVSLSDPRHGESCLSVTVTCPLGVTNERLIIEELLFLVLPPGCDTTGVPSDTYGMPCEH